MGIVVRVTYCVLWIYVTTHPHHSYTERNKLYILTHLGESGYRLQINPNYQANYWPNCCKFSSQIFVKSAEMKITILPLSLLLNLLNYTIEKCRFESHTDIALFMEICLCVTDKSVCYSIVVDIYIYIYIPWLFCTY